LVFFYFGEESYINRLAQETVPIHNALTGYDKAVLLRHETDVRIGDAEFELSELAEKKADVIDLPTRENFVKYLDELGRDGYVVDLFIFSHGWRDTFRVSRGTYGDNATIRASYIEANVQPLKLRMVWGTNCYGSTLLDTWRKLGARVCAGARYVNFYPTRFKKFIKMWLDGEAFGAAVSQSDTKLVRTPVQIYIPGDAIARMKQWGGNLLKAATILGRTKAAKDYFTNCWIAEDEWIDGKSGKQMMNYASRMIIEGNRKTTKGTVW
jgi:hypothetical protein